MQWQKIIESSLVELGVLAESESVLNNPNPSILSRSLLRLNGLLESWSNEDYLVPFFDSGTFTIPSNFSRSLIVIEKGNNVADISSIAPPVIIESFLYNRASWGVFLPVYQSERLVWSTEATQPNVTRFFYDRKYPRATLYLDGRPGENDTFQISGRASFPTVTESNLSEDDGLPIGYPEAIISNLSFNLASTFGVSLDGSRAGIMINAENTKKGLIRANTEMVDTEDVTPANLSDKPSTNLEDAKNQGQR